MTSKDGYQVLRESFLSFIAVTNKTGVELAETILQVLRDEGVVVSNMRGQGYGGCASMTGIHKGVQAEIKRIVPQALFFHYASHCLNLVLAHSVKNTRNQFDRRDHHHRVHLQWLTAQGESPQRLCRIDYAGA